MRTLWPVLIFAVIVAGAVETRIAFFGLAAMLIGGLVWRAGKDLN